MGLNFQKIENNFSGKKSPFNSLMGNAFLSGTKKYF